MRRRCLGRSFGSGGPQTSCSGAPPRLCPVSAQAPSRPALLLLCMLCHGICAMHQRLALPLRAQHLPAWNCWLHAGSTSASMELLAPCWQIQAGCIHVCYNPKIRSAHPCCAFCRLVKEDFELHGKRIRKGATILASMLYAKACDPRLSAGDHVKSAIPLHMDIHQLHASVKPERWLDPSNKLDMAVSPLHTGHQC